MEHLLSTERLSLIPFNEQDVALFHELNTDPFIRKFLWDDEVIDVETSQEIILKNEAHFKDDKYGLWKIQIKGSSEIIGYVGLWYFFDEPQPQLIYAILEPYAKNGYATEAASRIMDYSFNHLDFEYLIAATDEPHKASQAVASRLGMSLIEKRVEDGKSTLFFKLEKG